MNFSAMTLKGAIFDADGVLIDSMPIWDDLGARYLRGLGVVPEEGLSVELFRLSIEQGCEYMRKHYGLAQSADEIRAGLLGIVGGFYRHEVRLKPGVSEFLAAMKARGVPMVIATAGDRELLTSALERNGIAGYFAGIFTCTELHTTKHDPDIYMACAEFLGLEPSDVGVFEDSLSAVEAAKRAGFMTFGVEDDASRNDRERIRSAADYYIESFRGGITE